MAGAAQEHRGPVGRSESQQRRHVPAAVHAASSPAARVPQRRRRALSTRSITLGSTVISTAAEIIWDPTATTAPTSKTTSWTIPARAGEIRCRRSISKPYDTSPATIQRPATQMLAAAKTISSAYPSRPGRIRSRQRSTAHRLNILVFNPSVSTHDDDLRSTSGGRHQCIRDHSWSCERGRRCRRHHKSQLLRRKCSEPPPHRRLTPDSSCGTPKTITALGDVSGICPEGPTLSGSYLMSVSRIMHAPSAFVQTSRRQRPILEA